MKITILIVAGLKRKKELVRCLNSINASTFKNFEIIIVDNSCDPDLSLEIKNKFSDVQIIRMPRNTGIFAYNVGFLNAKGKYVLALDDDCEIKKDTLRKIVSIFDAKPKNIGVLSLNMFNPLLDYYYYDHYIKQKLTNIFTFVGGACVFRRDIFEKVGLYDSDFFCWVHEDDLAVRILKKGYKINFEKEIIINHYEKNNFNLKKTLLIFRNKAWFNIKNFSFFLSPALIIKDFFWLFSISTLKNNLVKSLFCFVFGTLIGYLSFFKVIKKRSVMPFKIQIKFLKYYFLTFKFLLTKILYKFGYLGKFPFSKNEVRKAYTSRINKSS